MYSKSVSLVVPVLLSLVLTGCTDMVALQDSSVTSANRTGVEQHRQEILARPYTDNIVMLSRKEAIGTDEECRFRMIGSETGPTSLFLVICRGESESEYFVDRCADIDTDEFLPEGLLMPIRCDGRRIVLTAEDGSFVVRGGSRQVNVPMSSG